MQWIVIFLGLGLDAVDGHIFLGFGLDAVDGHISGVKSDCNGWSYFWG